MCGIIGYAGSRKAKKILLDGLASLEYRGYDSAGIALCAADGSLRTIKCSGRVSELAKKADSTDFDANLGIGHTRWATHGGPTEANAHPHASKRCVIVHNGIIDNCLELRDELAAQGYTFVSDTDTEAAAHLIDREYTALGDPAKALYSAARYLCGSYAIAVIFPERSGEIWAIRRDNPLIAATSPDGAFLASDIPALLSHTRMIYRPKENEVICINESGITKHSADGAVETIIPEETELGVSAADKDGYDHFMLKEIHEQPDAIRRAASHRINSEMLPDFSTDGISEEFWTSFDSISIIACGSATHAGLVGRYVIEKLSGVPVTVNTASEYRYDPPAIVGKTLALAISQSGETADTLAGLRLAKSQSHPSAAIINAVGSAIAREADCVIYTGAGPEIAVATTKGYATQVAVLCMMGIKLGLVKGKLSKDEAARLCRELSRDIPAAVSEIIGRRDEIRELAIPSKDAQDLYFIGRGPDFPAATECSLKLKEISYVHSEAYAAGELKHGTLSLVEVNTPVVALANDSRYFDKMAGNIREVRARGGRVTLICTDDFPHPDEYGDSIFVLPKTEPLFSPLVSVAACQILSYEIALLRGCDVDHPRNLAKSVTVE